MRPFPEKSPIAGRKVFLATAGITLFVVLLLVRLSAAPRVPAQGTPSAPERPVFDVASIKPSKNGDQGASMRRQPGGLYRATNLPLRALMASAYFNEFPPKGKLIFGGPAWIDTEQFDIEARAQGNPGSDQERLMLQSLLEDRFKLVIHHETRQLPIYALVTAKPGKTGPQLHEHSGDTKCADPAAGPLPQPSPGAMMSAYCGGFFMSPASGGLRETGNKITMEMLVPFLSQSVDRTIVNSTGLSGTFDFALEFAPDLGPGSQRGGAAPDPSAPPSIFTAVQEQLGLKLEPETGPVDVLVIDHVEQPSEN